MAGLMIGPTVIAFAFGESAQLLSFSITSIFVGLVSGSILLLTPKPRRRSNPSDGLAVALLGWVVMGIVAAPPFVIGVANSSVLAAIHEAVSCVTTTGHSVIRIGDGGWPVSLIVWRGLLHIVGAIATLTIAASIFAAINLGGAGIHKTELFTIPDDSFFNAVPRVLSAVTSITLVLIAIFVILYVLAGGAGSQALIDAVSAITTGMVDPVQNNASVMSVSRAIITSVALVFGALGLFFALQLRRAQILSSFDDPEVYAFLIAIAVFAGIGLIAGYSVFEAFSWGLTSLSTSGIEVLQIQTEETLPTALLVLPALIGGSALSAAGGIKLGRLVILFRRAAQEFGRLGYRGSVVKFVYRGKALEESSVIGVWVYLIGYISAITTLFCVFAFSGVDFGVAVQTAIGAISNSGALLDQQIVFGDHHLTLIIAMLLGRWEVLALLPVFVPAFWRK